MKEPRSKPRSSTGNPGLNKVACTVSAAALMLGVSQAATVGLHFQENYCGSAAYSGFPVTLTAFGIPPSGWENLTPMDTGYGACASPMTGYTLNEVVSTNTATDGLNPLPNGSLNVTWFGPTANFSGFAGYGHNPPGYDGDPPVPIPTGEWQIYSTFLRDGINFGPIDNAGHGSPGGDNNQPGYSVDITGLKSVFTNNAFVIELIAASDSMQALTNAFIVDAAASTTNSVTYPNTPFPFRDEGGSAWLRGHGGGLSTVSSALNTDHVKIVSNHPQHGGTGVAPTGFDNAGTISGFIITDKPVVSMSPQPVLAGPGDTITLNPYAIGVPPLSYHWRQNGVPIPNATNSFFTISNVSPSQAGNYELVVTNDYGATTSSVAVVTEDMISVAIGTNYVADSNPSNPPRVGLNMGAAWLSSNSDGTISRSGVMQFVAANSDKITVVGTTNFDATTGTIMFWMRSAGTDTSASGSFGAALFGRHFSSSGYDLIFVQQDGGNIYFNAPNGSGSSANLITSSAIVSDNNWHLVALTFDQSAAGGVSLYIDGNLDTTSLNSTAWSSVAGKEIEMGFSSDTLWRSYDGLLADVRFYSRQLSAAEVASVYNTGALVDTANLQMWLDFGAPPGQGFSLAWLVGNVILQSATTVQGPYTDVPAAVAPYNATTGVGQKYFRYRGYIPKSTVSNPYLM